MGLLGFDLKLCCNFRPQICNPRLKKSFKTGLQQTMVTLCPNGAARHLEVQPTASVFHPLIVPGAAVRSAAQKHVKRKGEGAEKGAKSVDVAR